MPNQHDLPHLLRLLEDDSPSVRTGVTDALVSFGSDLGSALDSLPHPPNPETRDLLVDILSVSNRRWLEEVWPLWMNVPQETRRLEHALTLLSEYLEGRIHPTGLGPLLDTVAADYRVRYGEPDVTTLAEYLFLVRGLRGNEADYHDPQNSNLIRVLETGFGLPISLTAIYMLVGWRLGLGVEGCNFPGHFLARVDVGDRPFLVDCFNGGTFIEPRDFLRLDTTGSGLMDRLLTARVSPERMIDRSLNNLARAFAERSNATEVALVGRLKRTMRERGANPDTDAYPNP